MGVFLAKMCASRRKNHGCWERKPEGTSSARFGLRTTAKCGELIKRCADWVGSRTNDKDEVVEGEFSNFNFCVPSKRQLSILLNFFPFTDIWYFFSSSKLEIETRNLNLFFVKFTVCMEEMISHQVLISSFCLFLSVLVEWEFSFLYSPLSKLAHGQLSLVWSQWAQMPGWVVCFLIGGAGVGCRVEWGLWLLIGGVGVGWRAEWGSW